MLGTERKMKCPLVPQVLQRWSHHIRNVRCCIHFRTLLIFDFNCASFLMLAIQPLQWVHVGSVADVSAVHAAFIFRVEVTRVGEFMNIWIYVQQTQWKGE